MVKRCSHGLCKSDTRYPERVKNVTFIPFPKPLTNIEKCKKWIKLCGRPIEKLNPSKINSNRYVCSKHFVYSSGPTKEFPDPLPVDPFTSTPNSTRKAPSKRFDFNSQRRSNNRVLKTATCLRFLKGIPVGVPFRAVLDPLPLSDDITTSNDVETFILIPFRSLQKESQIVNIVPVRSKSKEFAKRLTAAANEGQCVTDDVPNFRVKMFGVNTSGKGKSFNLGVKKKVSDGSESAVSSSQRQNITTGEPLEDLCEGKEEEREDEADGDVHSSRKTKMSDDSNSSNNSIDKLCESNACIQVKTEKEVPDKQDCDDGLILGSNTASDETVEEETDLMAGAAKSNAASDVSISNTDTGAFTQGDQENVNVHKSARIQSKRKQIDFSAIVDLSEDDDFFEDESTESCSVNESYNEGDLVRAYQQLEGESEDDCSLNEVAEPTLNKTMERDVGDNILPKKKRL